MNHRLLVTAFAACLLAACGTPEESDWPALEAELAAERQALEAAPEPGVGAADALPEQPSAATWLMVVPDGAGGVRLVSLSSASSPGDTVSSTQDPIPTKNRRDARDVKR